MRILIITALVATLSGPALAQDVSFPNPEFPQPGTFCGPFTLCQPLVTRGTGN